jgi:flavin-dependent dehydrogenase
MTTDQLDAVVIGAGPAGCAAALTLAGSGARVCLLECGSRGKDKACGDALVSRAVSCLEDLGIGADRLLALGGHRFEHLQLVSEGRLLWQTSGQGGFTIPRRLLDDELRNVAEAKVQLRYGARVQKVAPGPDGIEMALGGGVEPRSHLRARGVVLATGANNQIAVQHGIDGSPLRGLAISTYLPVPGGECPVIDFAPGCRPGYRWWFPMGGGVTNVGACLLDAGTGPRLRGQIRSLVAERGAGDKPLSWRGGVGPLWSGRGRVWHAPWGLLCCGDSAGLIDPINGAGVTAALQSGAEAGRALARHLGGASGQPLARYSEWVRETFESRYAVTEFRRSWGSFAGLDGLG